MMIADLLDQEDLRDRFLSLGIPVTQEQSPDACCRAALAWRTEQDRERKQALDEVIRLLIRNSDSLLPEIKTAIQTCFPMNDVH
ncbi:hypothetical protein [Gynuella sp.]|uniref:hypothetical protein n=1 Tax=Gynuella sp. TaxID=2969146 RepID=UPI003D14C523